MANFADLLNQPLPSQSGMFNESFDDMADDDTLNANQTDMFGEESDVDDDPTIHVDDVATAADDADDDDDDDDDFDPDDLDDDELASLDAELSSDSLDSVVNDNENEVQLNPEEEIEADDMMSMAATSMLVNNELNAEEKAEFLSSESEIAYAIREGFLTDADIAVMQEDCQVMTEGNNYNKKMIIRLDAAAKKKQLYALAVNVSAAAKHDPDYLKLKKVMKIKKILRRKLQKKYHGEALKRMKIYFNRLKKSKSNTLAKIGKKVSHKKKKGLFK